MKLIKIREWILVVFLGFSRIRIMAGGGFRRLPPILRLGTGHDGLVGSDGVVCSFGNDPFLGIDDHS